MIEIRHHRAALLFAALALSLLGAAPPSPFPARPQTAQNPTIATPENRAPETAPQNMPPMSPPAFQSSTPGRFQCPYDFWIASSRRCQQAHAKSCFAGQLEYYHADSNNIFSKKTQPEFQQWLQPGVPVCIVVHGSYVQSTDLLDEDPHMYQWIRSAAPQQPIHIVFYSWPSDGPITYLPPVDIGILGRRASFNALYLADLIATIPPDHPVCVVGHSHGARTVASALHLLAGGEVQGHYMPHVPQQCPRMRAVLIAGALDHHWIVPGQRYGRALFRVESMLNVKNDRDIALNAYPYRRPFSHRAIGEAGVQQRDRWGLGALNPRIRDMDVTAWITTGHLWYNYYQRPEIAYALRPYIYFDERTPSSYSASALLQGRAASNPAGAMPRPPQMAVPPANLRATPLHGTSESDSQTSGERS